MNLTERLIREEMEMMMELKKKDKRIAELESALEATHRYFMALTKSWQENDGRVVSETGSVIEGSEDIERLCNVAGELVGKWALSRQPEMKP